MNVNGESETLYYLVRDNDDTPLSLIRTGKCATTANRYYITVAGKDGLCKFIKNGKFNTDEPYGYQLVAAGASSPIVTHWLAHLGTSIDNYGKLLVRSEAATKASTEDWFKRKEKALELIENGVRNSVIASRCEMSPAMVSKLKKSMSLSQ
ncbi:hypothetical protein [uncultured Microbulbifer sp.]|uniref:hypothetical protein n=1 Tax=uncultured Microbulbifer sp. TaxID=348147 RepID=UPI0026237E56|nr:hypothetical protein [uncultured Microbulbifer sp.]